MNATELPPDCVALILRRRAELDEGDGLALEQTIVAGARVQVARRQSTPVRHRHPSRTSLLPRRSAWLVWARDAGTYVYK